METQSYLSENRGEFPTDYRFDPQAARAWMEANWQSYCAVWLSLYIAAIAWLKRDREKKEKLTCKGPLLVWNISLAVFSLIAATKILPWFLYALSGKGYYYSICSASYLIENRETSYWNLLFALSKAPELGDTLFLLLKKQPLRFLHWYHHVTVLLYCWHAHSEYASTGLWFTAMNLVVHSIMYSYFAARTFGVNVRREIAMLITTLQILQMIMGFIVSLSAGYFKFYGHPCQVTPHNAIISILMYLSYLALFVAFFRDSYVRKPRVHSKKDS